MELFCKLRPSLEWHFTGEHNDTKHVICFLALETSINKDRTPLKMEKNGVNSCNGMTAYNLSIANTKRILTHWNFFHPIKKTKSVVVRMLVLYQQWLQQKTNLNFSWSHLIQNISSIYYIHSHRMNFYWQEAKAIKIDCFLREENFKSFSRLLINCLSYNFPKLVKQRIFKTWQYLLKPWRGFSFFPNFFFILILQVTDEQKKS